MNQTIHPHFQRKIDAIISDSIDAQSRENVTEMLPFAPVPLIGVERRPL